MTKQTAEVLAEAVKHFFEQSDGITVWMPSEVVQAIYEHIRENIEAAAVHGPAVKGAGGLEWKAALSAVAQQAEPIAWITKAALKHWQEKGRLEGAHQYTFLARAGNADAGEEVSPLRVAIYTAESAQPTVPAEHADHELTDWLRELVRFHPNTLRTLWADGSPVGKNIVERMNVRTDAPSCVVAPACMQHASDV